MVAHGSRDEAWARPFEALAARLTESLGADRVCLAYLQFLQPDVGQAIAQAIASGWRNLVVLPLLLGEGAHVRQDLPHAVAAATAGTPDVDVRVLPSLLDDAGVLAAVEALARSAILPP